MYALLPGNSGFVWNSAEQKLESGRLFCHYHFEAVIGTIARFSKGMQTREIE